MTLNTNATVYTVPEKTKYYLVPNTYTLPIGNYAIQTLTGKEQLVNATTIAPFEISSEEAKEHLQDDMEQALEQIKNTFTNFMAVAKEEAKKQRDLQNSEPLRNKAELLTSLLGFAPDDVQQNPEMVKEKLSEVFAKTKTVLEGMVSNDPEKQEAARNNMQALQDKLEKEGIKTTENMAQIPDKLRDTYFTPTARQEQQQRKATALEQLANQVNQSAKLIEKELHQEIKKLEQETNKT